MSILQTIDLKKYYGTEPNITRALNGVNFTVEQGEFVAVVGTSGSGKSTLLHMMGGLDTPTSGSVIVRGEELAKKNDDELTIFRRRNIGFIFQNYNLVPILNVYENIGVNFTVEQGEFVAVVGTSGSGKSTLLHMMGGLDTPTSGSVIVRGEELAKKNDDELTIFRRRNIGFIFQNYNLVPILNVYENIVLPVELDGDTVDQKFMDEVVYMLALEDKLENMPNNLSGGQQQRVAIARALITKPADTVDQKFMDEVVYMLALEDKLENMPNNLSGGQQQRVAIARALITKPAIILADEPTGNLDSKTSADVLGLLKRTSGEFNQTIVMITHNNEIAQLADRIVRIEDGKIVG